MSEPLSNLQRAALGSYRKQSQEVFVLTSNVNLCTVLITNANHPEVIERVAINRAGKLVGRFRYRLVRDQVAAVA